MLAGAGKRPEKQPRTARERAEKRAAELLKNLKQIQAQKRVIFQLEKEALSELENALQTLLKSEGKHAPEIDSASEGSGAP
jgi:hypothetical protein